MDDTGCLKAHFGTLDKKSQVKQILSNLEKINSNSPLEKKYLTHLKENIGSYNYLVEIKRYLAMNLLEKGEVDVSQHYTHFLGQVYNTDYLALELPYLFSSYDDVEKFIASNTAENLLNSTIKSKGLRGLAYTFSGGLIDFVSQRNLDMTKFNNWNKLKIKPSATEVKQMTFDYLHANYQKKHGHNQYNTNFAHRPTFLLRRNVLTAEEINLPDVVYWLVDELLEGPRMNKKIFEQKTNNITLNETQHSLISTIMMVREDIFSKMNEKDQKIFKEVAIDAGKFERNLTIDRYNEAKKKLIDNGFKWVEYPTALKKEFRTKFEPLYKQVYQKYPNVKKVVEEIESNKNENHSGVAAL
jgi:TRAP-type C4-dicarboxylate transport system substrate-binding protein